MTGVGSKSTNDRVGVFAALLGKTEPKKIKSRRGRRASKRR